jgi:hypothetical protein
MFFRPCLENHPGAVLERYLEAFGHRGSGEAVGWLRHREAVVMHIADDRAGGVSGDDAVIDLELSHCAGLALRMGTRQEHSPITGQWQDRQIS